MGNWGEAVGDDSAPCENFGGQSVPAQGPVEGSCQAEWGHDMVESPAEAGREGQDVGGEAGVGEAPTKPVQVPLLSRSQRDRWLPRYLEEYE